MKTLQQTLTWATKRPKPLTQSTITQQALNKAMSLAAEAISLANDYSGDDSETAKYLQKQYEKLQREIKDQ